MKKTILIEEEQIVCDKCGRPVAEVASNPFVIEMAEKKVVVLYPSYLRYMPGAVIKEFKLRKRKDVCVECLTDIVQKAIVDAIKNIG